MALKKNPQILVREEEQGKYLVFNRTNSLPLVMNSTAYRIWSLCEGGVEVTSIHSKLMEEYDLEKSNFSAEQLTAIIEEQIVIFQNTGLLVEVP